MVEQRDTATLSERGKEVPALFRCYPNFFRRIGRTNRHIIPTARIHHYQARTYSAFRCLRHWLNDANRKKLVDVDELVFLLFDFANSRTINSYLTQPVYQDLM